MIFRGPPARSVDATGAGDIFSGALLYCLAAGKAAAEAVRFAVAAASLSTEKLGVIESIPTRAAVEKLLKVAQR